MRPPQTAFLPEVNLSSVISRRDYYRSWQTSMYLYCCLYSPLSPTPTEAIVPLSEAGILAPATSSAQVLAVPWNSGKLRLVVAGKGPSEARGAASYESLPRRTIRERTRASCTEEDVHESAPQGQNFARFCGNLAHFGAFVERAEFRSSPRSIRPRSTLEANESWKIYDMYSLFQHIGIQVANFGDFQRLIAHYDMQLLSGLQDALLAPHSERIIGQSDPLMALMGPLLYPFLRYVASPCLLPTALAGGAGRQVLVNLVPCVVTLPL